MSRTPRKPTKSQQKLLEDLEEKIKVYDFAKRDYWIALDDAVRSDAPIDYLTAHTGMSVKEIGEEVRTARQHWEWLAEVEARQQLRGILKVA